MLLRYDPKYDSIFDTKHEGPERRETLSKPWSTWYPSLTLIPGFARGREPFWTGDVFQFLAATCSRNTCPHRRVQKGPEDVSENCKERICTLSIQFMNKERHRVGGNVSRCMASSDVPLRSPSDFTTVIWQSCRRSYSGYCTTCTCHTRVASVPSQIGTGP